MGLTEDVMAILDAHRKRYGWAPGHEWNPYRCVYEPPGRVEGHDEGHGEPTLEQPQEAPRAPRRR